MHDSDLREATGLRIILFNHQMLKAFLIIQTNDLDTFLRIQQGCHSTNNTPFSYLMPALASTSPH